MGSGAEDIRRVRRTDRGQGAVGKSSGLLRPDPANDMANASQFDRLGGGRDSSFDESDQGDLFLFQRGASPTAVAASDNRVGAAKPYRYRNRRRGRAGKLSELAL